MGLWFGRSFLCCAGGELFGALGRGRTRLGDEALQGVLRNGGIMCKVEVRVHFLARIRGL